MTFSERPSLRQDFTDDRNKLASALRRIAVGGGTALYDALEESLRKVKSGTHDKKAILLITDGEDTSSYATFDEASLSVRESELLVYCLGISPSSSGLFNESTPPISRGPSGRRDPNRGPSIGIPGIPGIPDIPGIPGIPGGPPRRWPLASSQFPQRSPGSRGSNPDTVDIDRKSVV